ncbi:MAG: alkaline phosphatase D family protein [Bacteroidota bacterium]|nr:alkaline phosphatase D family protein [Bacteroidota bacterium]
MTQIRLISLSIILLFSSFSMETARNTSDDRLYFGNGIHNGWADQNSIVIWTRLTKNPEMNYDGEAFIPLTSKQHNQLNKSGDYAQIHAAQIPVELCLEDMEGACTGTFGEVKLNYHPDGFPERLIETSWDEVDSTKNFTKQWKLSGLQADTHYEMTVYSRKNSNSGIFTSIDGSFYIPPNKRTSKNISFCVVTGHDYNRRDDSVGGHKIYPSMAENQPDFFVHTGDTEYYDKFNPWAMTEDLMHFKWDRLFALPFQRGFYTNTTSYFIKDDHDLLRNDTYPGDRYGTVSFERGLEIFEKEQFPSNNKPYKTIRWGKDLQIWIMEGRNFRSNNNLPDSPDKTIWGKEQKEWFFRTIEESNATFKLIVSPTPILGPDRERKNDNHANAGFQHEGDEIRNFINQFDNVFIACGDRHWQYVTHLDSTNLWEFSTGPGSDSHSGGWPKNDKRPEHRFLRVKGGYLLGNVYRENGIPILKFQHCDVDGNVVHEEIFR